MYVCPPKYLTIRRNKWSAKRIEIKFCSSSSNSRKNCSNPINHHYWRNSKFIYTEYAFYKFRMHEKKKRKQNSRLLLDNFFFLFS